MTSTQIIEAINAIANETISAEEAHHLVNVTLRHTNPCAACGGHGIDETKPFDVSVIVTQMGGQKCDTCDGRGFVVEDGDDAVYAWVATR